MSCFLVLKLLMLYNQDSTILLMPLLLYVTIIACRCFPGYMFGKIARDVGEDSCAFWSSFFYSCALLCCSYTFIRWKLRQKQNIPARTAMYSTHIIIIMELSCSYQYSQS